MFVIYEHKLVYDYRLVISLFCIFTTKSTCILNQYNVLETRGYINARNSFLFLNHETNGNVAANVKMK